MYRIRLRSKKVRKQLDDLSVADFRRVDAKIAQLRENPRSRGVKKLFDDIYHIRVGDYRVIYRVDDAKRLVDIGKVERRRIFSKTWGGCRSDLLSDRTAVSKTALQSSSPPEY